MLTSLLSLILIAETGQVLGKIVPTIAHPDFPQQFQEAQIGKGVGLLAAMPACETLAEDIPLCFREQKEGKRRWLSQGDLSRREQSTAALKAQIQARIWSNPLRKSHTVEGIEWWQVEAIDGEESLLFLHPEWLGIVGDNAVVAAPARGVVLSWNAGDTDNDKILAVGVRRIYEGSEFPVTPKIFRHTAKGWVVWGEAVMPKNKPADQKSDKPKTGDN